MFLEVKVIFKGKPVHKIRVRVLMTGAVDKDEAFKAFLDTVNDQEHRWFTADGYSFRPSDVLYYALVHYEEDNAENE